MSTLQKMPYVNKAINTLSDEQANLLLSLINGSVKTPVFKSLVNSAHYLTNADKGVSYVSLETKDAVFTGYLIYTDSYCVLVSYAPPAQELAIVKIDPAANKYELVNEYLTILEFRFIIEKMIVSHGGDIKVQIDDIESFEDGNPIPAGSVITTDGEGGAVWAPPQERENENVVSFENVNLSSGSATISNTGANWVLMTETDLDCVLNLYLTSQNVYPLGTLVELKRISVSDDEVIFGGMFDYSNNETFITYTVTARCQASTVLVTINELEANQIPSEGEYPYLHFLKIGGEGYHVLNPTELDVILEDYAKKDGNYPTMTVGKSETAKNVEPYSDDSGAGQSNPFISQGTGTDNNTAIVTTGNYAQLREKQGNTLHVTQLCATRTVSGTDTVANSIIEAVNNNVENVVGHKYIAIFDLAVSDTSKINNFRIRYPFVSSNIATSATKKTYYIYGEATDAVSFRVQLLKPVDTATDATYEFTNLTFVDITSWPSEAIADLTAHPENFFRWYNGSLSFNAGSLENANGVKLVCTHRNLFNNNYAQGSISQQTGEEYSDSNYVRSADFTRAVPNKPIYVYRDANDTSVNRVQYFIFDNNENFIRGGYLDNISGNAYVKGKIQLGANEWLVKTACVGTLANPPKITISLYYTTAEGGEGYDQYYEYKEPTVIDTGSEQLRSAGSVHDLKLPDGTIQRNIGAVDLGTLNWNKQGDVLFYRSGLNPAVKPSASPMSRMPNLIMSDPKYVNTYIYNLPKTSGYYVAITETGGIYINREDGTDMTAEQFKTAMSGVYLYYELATPTTEEGTRFPENAEIDDYGMMYWLDANDNLVGIPQGAKLFYPFNYAGTLDDLYHYVGGDMQKIIRTYSTDAEELAENPDINKNWDTTPTQNSVKPVTSGGIFVANERLKDALGGTLRQVLAATKNIDFNDTDVVDLGSLSWTYVGTYGTATNVFVAYSYYVKGVATASTANVLCSKYKTKSTDGLYYSNGSGIAVLEATPNSIRINDTSAGTDATAFKAAMQGVLLAYEKAE